VAFPEQRNHTSVTYVIERSEPRWIRDINIFRSNNMLFRVDVVPNRTVFCDWRFDFLCRSLRPHKCYLAFATKRLQHSHTIFLGFEIYIRYEILFLDFIFIYRVILTRDLIGRQACFISPIKHVVIGNGQQNYVDQFSPLLKFSNTVKARKCWTKVFVIIVYLYLRKTNQTHTKTVNLFFCIQ